MFKAEIIDAIHVAEWMIGLYELRGGGHSQKEALKVLIEVARKEEKKMTDDEIERFEK